MVVNVVRHYKSCYDKEFKLTESQRSLILQTVCSLVYLLLGAAVYAYAEDWDYLDTVYWVDYTILTVGTGDYTPTTLVGRALLFPFAIGGITILGMIICTIQSLVLEQEKLIVNTRVVEKQQQRVLKELHMRNDRSQGRLTEYQELNQKFKLMRQIQDYAIRKHRWMSLLASAFAWFLLWFVSAAVFKVTEEAQSWSYFDSVQFVYSSPLIIGSGELYPKSDAGKAFFVFWSLLAIPSLTILISNICDTIAMEMKSDIGSVRLYRSASRGACSSKSRSRSLNGGERSRQTG